MRLHPTLRVWNVPGETCYTGVILHGILLSSVVTRSHPTVLYRANASRTSLA